jgi:hypothetical protein
MPVYTFTTFDDPLALTGTTQAIGVNGTNQIATVTRLPLAKTG